MLYVDIYASDPISVCLTTAEFEASSESVLLRWELLCSCNVREYPVGILTSPFILSRIKAKTNIVRDVLVLMSIKPPRNMPTFKLG